MTYQKGQYGYDLEWIQKHQTVVELVGESSRVLVAPDLQGRVMTSTATGESGYSFGWVNHELFASEERSEQFNAFGGEERFWLGPEGGPFAFFFDKEKAQTMANWRVPQALDTMAWEVQEVMPEMVTLYKAFKLKNYAETEFELAVTRRVGIILPDEIDFVLNCKIGPSVRTVAYESLNQVQNAGQTAWEKATGLPSIWMLSMYNPSPDVVAIVPFKDGEADAALKTDYFGEIPADRLKVRDGYLLFKADGRFRSKLGIPPSIAKRYLGSYDWINHRLTILETTINPQATDYVNSAWGEEQEKPFGGDLINAYNDGPLENGQQLGPFYELESSSEALQLKPGQSHIHIQRTYHFEGSEDDLNEIATKILGVSVYDLKDAFD
ncbi:hypothetical protein C8N47_11318 [Mangrovibacterium marinum]|uniref:Uncharacterized protein n=1 Tax=Mangrovibacterium marinum TaxID=1639118 RepID=A0A2T5BZQ9_9BACT|nr:DUF6786 family protein [Mangrovibacterium marinum]PTN07753.1 hypothetical protein C8N47_11318 [Mangrovibacterium marinum]